MAKKRKRKDAAAGGGACWTGHDHAARDEQRHQRQRRKLEKKLLLRRQEPEGQEQERREEESGPDQQHDERQQERERDLLRRQEEKDRRTAALTHETREKRDAMKLKLHLKKAQRDVERVRERLSAWDPVEESRLQQQLQQQKAEEEDEEGDDASKKKKKKGRKGPESWKLKGAARPAWQVYDFDTRYVDPHIEAHKEASKKAKRSVNILAAYKGKLDSVPAMATPLVREYLGLLMQLGHLSEESKHYKAARSSWLECVELEGEHVAEPMTTARECLMRMYIKVKRYEAVARFGERVTDDDTSAWIRYSYALACFVLKKDATEVAMLAAIKANPFCAYYIAYYDTFESVMEYVEELVEALDDGSGGDDDDDVPQSSFIEAIEYCAKEAERWTSSGAAESVRDIIRQATRGRYDQLSPAHLEWENRLAAIEAQYKNTCTSGVADDEPSSSDVEEDAEETGSVEDETEPPALPLTIDVSMYAGMFRTAMEMLEDSGELIRRNRSGAKDDRIADEAEGNE